jgi:predicted Zn-dependent peptidase
VTLQNGDPHLQVERFQLGCGLDVVIHPDRTIPLAGVSVWYRAGSSDEAAGTSGRAHLFEHLFKNSQHLAGKQHYEILRRAGAVDANASTSADRTAYHEVVPSADLELALWIESDRMGYFLPGLTEERLATQKAVVLSERRQRYENVAYGAERFAVAEALYPDGHPHRYLTIGRREHIAETTIEDIQAWYRTWYVPANAQLVIAGDVDVGEATRLVERWFGSFPAAQRPVRPTVRSEVSGSGSRSPVIVEDRFAAIRRLHRTWRSPAAFAPGEAELDVLASVLGSPGTGVLWRELVYARPWAQRVQVWQSSARLGGELHVVVDLRTGADPDAVRAVIDDVLSRARAGDPTVVDDRSVTRARVRRDAGFLWRLEGIGRRIAALQRYLLFLDDPAGLAVELARYRAITVAGVVAAAAAWLQPDRAIEVETRALRAGRPIAVTAPEIEDVV